MSRVLNNNKALVFIIAILLIANVAMLIFFLYVKPIKKDDRGDRYKVSVTDFLKEEMKFSQEQLKQFDSLKKAHWRDIRPLYKGMNDKKDAFYDHLSDSTLDEQVLLAEADSIAAQQKQMDLHAFVHFRAIRDLCTPGQKPVYDSLIENIVKRVMGPFRRVDNRPFKPGEDRSRTSNSTNRK